MSNMIVINSLVAFLLLLAAASQTSLAGHLLANQLGNKVFDYQGSMPIKDDRVGDWNASAAVTGQASTQMKPEDQKAAELACWKLISEESGESQLSINQATAGTVCLVISHDLTSARLVDLSCHFCATKSRS